MAQYEAYATSLAFLRHRGRHGKAGADFVVREGELLNELWRRKDVARPALEHAARMTAPWTAPGGYGHPAWHGQGQANVHGHVHGQGPAYTPGPAYGYGYGYPAGPHPVRNPYQT